MVSILINLIQHEQYFSFQVHISAVCLFLLKSYHIMLKSHVSSSVNNKCNRVKGQHWRWLILCLDVISYYIIMFLEVSQNPLKNMLESLLKSCRPADLFHVCFSLYPMKKTFILQQTYLYMLVTDILKFYEVLFCTFCKAGY